MGALEPSRGVTQGDLPVDALGGRGDDKCGVTKLLVHMSALLALDRSYHDRLLAKKYIHYELSSV